MASSAQTSSVEAHARRAKNSTVLERTTRFGFVGYGIVHALLAWAALQIAYGSTAEEADQSGAMRELAGQPLGEALLTATAGERSSPGT